MIQAESGQTTYTGSAGLNKDNHDRVHAEQESKGEEGLSKHGKIASLLRSLEDVLEKDGLDEMAQIMGKESLDRCLMLRTKLRQKTSARKSPALSPPSCPRSHDVSNTDVPNIPKSPSALSITPWKSSEIPGQLPALPEVLDPTLRAAAFTHHGMGTGRINDLSYERLEWVGDSYLYLTSTLLISQTFPSLFPGKCSQLRERLIKNVTLADYARKYGFEHRAKLPDHIVGTPTNAAQGVDLTKIMGDIFEAYVAAVILSDPENGVARVTTWLKMLWSMTIKKEILNEEKSGMQIDSPMWRLRGDVEKIEIISSARAPLGSKEQLQKLLGGKDVKLTYRDAAPEKKDKHNKLPLFTIGVYLDGWGVKDKQLGWGRGNGKKDAGAKAAEMALANKNMMKMFMEKKKIHDMQTQIERQALETLEGT